MSASTVSSAKASGSKTDKLQSLEQVNEIAFTADEKKRMNKIFESMMKKEEALGKIDTEDVEAMVYVMPMTNVLRNDKREQPFERKDLLAGAPQATEDSWQVPRLVK